MAPNIVSCCMVVPQGRRWNSVSCLVACSTNVFAVRQEVTFRYCGDRFDLPRGRGWGYEGTRERKRKRERNRERKRERKREKIRIRIMREDSELFKAICRDVDLLQIEGICVYFGGETNGGYWYNEQMAMQKLCTVACSKVGGRR